MATKPTPPTVADPPLRSLGSTEFVTRSEAWFTFEAGPFYTYIVDSVTYIDDTNLDVQAAAVATNLFDLPLTNLGGYLIGVNNTEDGFEAVDVTEYTVTAYMETLLDDADAATARGTLGLGTFSTENTADFVQDQATWNTGTDTTESTITPAKLEAKLSSRGWVEVSTVTTSGGEVSLEWTDLGDYSELRISILSEATGMSSGYEKLQVSADGGSSWVSSGYNSFAANDDDGNSDSDGFRLRDSSVQTEIHAGVIRLGNFNNSNITYIDGVYSRYSKVSGTVGSVAYDSIRIYRSAGTFTSGLVFQVEGRV